MADQKISQLAALTGANLATDDEFVVVDTSTTSTKRMTSAELKLGLFASPALTGTPTAPTAATTTNTTQLATTAFVQQEIAANPSGFIFLAAADASNDATIDFTAFDGATYDAYLFVLSNVVPATDAVNLNMRTSTDGGSSYDSGTSAYSWHNASGPHDNVGNTPIWDGDGSDSEITIATDVGSGASEYGVTATIWVNGAHLAAYTHVHWNGHFDNGACFSLWGSGRRLSAADVDAVRFLFSSGNIESGTITMYGMRNA